MSLPEPRPGLAIRLRATRAARALVDPVNGRPVWYWVGPDGSVWLAQSRFGRWVMKPTNRELEQMMSRAAEASSPPAEFRRQPKEEPAVHSGYVVLFRVTPTAPLEVIPGPVIPTLGDAQDRAVREARANPGRTFTVARTIGHCRTEPAHAEWHPHLES